MAEFSQDTKQLSPSGMPIPIEPNSSHFFGMWSNAAEVQQITDIKVVFFRFDICLCLIPWSNSFQDDINDQLSHCCSDPKSFMLISICS